MTMPSAPSDDAPTLRCARHPSVETVLRCGKCDTPICPRCLVSTPVGARCPTCAQVKRFAFGLKTQELLKAVGFGLATGAVGTIIVGFIPFLGLLGYMVMGFAVGEAVSIGANRKRPRELGPIAVACVFIGFDIGVAILLAYRAQGAVPSALDLFQAGFVVLRRDLLALVGLLVGSLLAWMRVR